jgi:hypothetical protein
MRTQFRKVPSLGELAGTAKTRLADIARSAKELITTVVAYGWPSLRQSARDAFAPMPGAPTSVKGGANPAGFAGAGRIPRK